MVNMQEASYQSIRNGSIRLVVNVMILEMLPCVISFAQQREFFQSDVYDAISNMRKPLSYGYYMTSSSVGNRMTFDEWFDAPYATGNWMGARAFLEESGIVPVFSYLGNFASNISGGMAQGSSIASSVQLGAELNLYKITGIDILKNWSLVNTWVWRFGDSLSQQYVGNAFSVQQNFGSQTLNMQSLYLSYSKAVFDGDGYFMLKFGRMAAGDNFMTKPIYWLYMSNAMNGNPNGVFRQTKFSAYPGSTWGAMFELSGSEGGYFKSGVYQINSEEQEFRHGLDLSMSSASGVNLNAEAGWNINHDNSGKSPGNLSVGLVAGWYRAPHIDNPLASSGFNQTIYVQADYMVVNLGFPDRSRASVIKRDNVGDSYRDLRGIVVWGVVQYNPSDNLAEMPLFLNGGVLFNAPFPSRPDDVLCFGAAYGRYSGHLPQPEKNSYELMFELNYKVQVNRFFFIQPAVQYIINPKGGKYSDAIVLGMQFGASF